MRENRTFTILPVGVTEADERVLSRILKISLGSSRSYTVTSDQQPAPGKILVVNADSAAAVQNWRARYVTDEGKAMMPTVFASRQNLEGRAAYHVGLPFRATHVLSTLDQITIKELNYIPELTIGAEQIEPEISHSQLEAMVSSKHGSQGRYTAMVVDDSLPVRKQLELELKMLGATVEMAENGEQAMEMTKDKSYDIIFLDVMMPGIDGYKVCKAIKKDMRTKNTPVIMLTGKSSPFDKVKGTLAGCDSYLTKPLHHDDFQNVAKKYLSLS